jgi:LysR family transcriptional regulator, regulator for bpeEF and oprC
MDLNQMLVFAKVAEYQSFTKAGKDLGIEKSNVSAKIAKLENRLGVRLLNRTTRSVSLTEAGAGYYEFCADIIQRAEEAETYAESLASEPQGILRVSAPADLGQMITRSLIKPILDQYKKIKIELLLTNRRVDLIKENFDIAIRAGRSQSGDSSYIVRQITNSKIGLYAAPGYLENHGQPSTPDDLEKYEMIALTPENSFGVNVAIKAGLGKRSIHLTPSNRLKVNDMSTVIESALMGLGIAILPGDFVQKYIESGELIPVMPKLVFPEMGLYAIYPSRHLKSSKLTAFLEHLSHWQPLY